MKAIVAPMLLLALACGRIETGDQTRGVGQIVPMNAQPLSAQEASRIQGICQALAAKVARLDTTLPGTQTFAVIDRPCNGGTEVRADVPVNVQRMGPQFYYVNHFNGSSFIFPNVETPNSDLFAQLCNAQGTPFNSYRKANGDIVTVTTSSFSGNCPTTANQQCIQFQTATPSGSSARVHTRELLRFNINPTDPMVGFYTFRSMVSENFCPQGRSFERIAELK
jgi:hypothetical protein